AEARTERAVTRTEMAETRTEQAETRAEQAQTRTEKAETRAEQAETRTEAAETALERAVENRDEKATLSVARKVPSRKGGDQGVEQLTERQREILMLIAQGKNTKTIAAALDLSPKTIEYHRMKLMGALNLHDVAGLVRFAIGAGLIEVTGGEGKAT
ncbi:MAG: LuxR C-terminal-related transcriptional regulator, partial [Limisphaerales bacterium]